MKYSCSCILAFSFIFYLLFFMQKSLAFHRSPLLKASSVKKRLKCKRRTYTASRLRPPCTPKLTKTFWARFSNGKNCCRTSCQFPFVVNFSTSLIIRWAMTAVEIKGQFPYFSESPVSALISGSVHKPANMMIVKSQTTVSLAFWKTFIPLSSLAHRM